MRTAKQLHDYKWVHRVTTSIQGEHSPDSTPPADLIEAAVVSWLHRLWPDRREEPAQYELQIRCINLGPTSPGVKSQGQATWAANVLEITVSPRSLQGTWPAHLVCPDAKHAIMIHARARIGNDEDMWILWEENWRRREEAAAAEQDPEEGAPKKRRRGRKSEDLTGLVQYLTGRDNLPRLCYGICREGEKVRQIVNPLHLKRSAEAILGRTISNQALYYLEKHLILTDILALGADGDILRYGTSPEMLSQTAIYARRLEKDRLEAEKRRLSNRLVQVKTELAEAQAKIVSTEAEITSLEAQIRQVETDLTQLET